MKLSLRRTPDVIAFQLLDFVEKKKEANKWDLLKILGNESQFKIWIEDFLIPEKILEERREERYYFYCLTERGQLLHKLLKSGNLIKVFKRVSGKRLK